MISIIYSEFMKFKRTRILIILFFSGICLPMFLMFGCKANGIFVDWEFYTTLIELIMFMVLSIVIFAMLTSHLFAREFSEKTSSVLYTYPFSRVKIFFCKFFVLILMMCFVYIIQYGLMFLTGLLLKHDKLTVYILLKHVKIYGFSLMLQIAIMPVFIILALITRNNLSAIIFSVMAAGSNFVLYIVNNLVDRNIWLPFSLPMMPMLCYGEQKVNVTLVIITGIVMFFLGITICIAYMKKMDVT